MTEEMNRGAVDRQMAAGGVPPAPDNPDVFTTILESVARRIAGSAQVTGLTRTPLLEAISEVVAAAAADAVGKGGDLIPATKAIIMGVVRGSGATNEAALQILSHAARIIIHHTADRNGNPATAAKGAILGAIASARRMGVEIAKAASTAAQGAVEGAAESGSVTVDRVLGALREPIGGIKVALPQPLAN